MSSNESSEGKGMSASSLAKLVSDRIPEEISVSSGRSSSSGSKKSKVRKAKKVLRALAKENAKIADSAKPVSAVLSKIIPTLNSVNAPPMAPVPGKPHGVPHPSGLKESVPNLALRSGLSHAHSSRPALSLASTSRSSLSAAHTFAHARPNVASTPSMHARTASMQTRQHIHSRLSNASSVRPSFNARSALNIARPIGAHPESPSPPNPISYPGMNSRITSNVRPMASSSSVSRQMASSIRPMASAQMQNNAALSRTTMQSAISPRINSPFSASMPRASAVGSPYAARNVNSNVASRPMASAVNMSRQSQPTSARPSLVPNGHVPGQPFNLNNSALRRRSL